MRSIAEHCEGPRILTRNPAVLPAAAGTRSVTCTAASVIWGGLIGLKNGRRSLARGGAGHLAWHVLCRDSLLVSNEEISTSSELLAPNDEMLPASLALGAVHIVPKAQYDGGLDSLTNTL